MSNAQIRAELDQLFKNTAKAHHAAFADSDGLDPDWPIWYADQMKEALEKRTEISFQKSRLIYCLMNADYEYEASGQEGEWVDFYADRFMECYAPSETATEDKLSLYYLPSCPFCIRVLRVIDQLGITVELRNLLEDNAYRDDLIAARGRATVPVLHIQSPDKSIRWMPESLDIIDYLERSYSQVQ